MKEIKFEWSKPFYKRMQLYLLSLMFVSVGALIIKIDTYFGVAIAILGLPIWLMAITYGRLWIMKSGEMKKILHLKESR